MPPHLMPLFVISRDYWRVENATEWSSWTAHPDNCQLKAVEFGLDEGKLDFYAVVISLVNIVMLHVCVENGIAVVNNFSVLVVRDCHRGGWDEMVEVCWGGAAHMDTT